MKRWMKKAAIPLAALAAYVGISLVEPAFADQKKEQQRTEIQNWKFTTGATRSWPKLNEANKAIKDIGDEVRSIAPATRDFEDWHDVYTGTFGLGAERMFDIGGRRVGVGLFYAMAKGDVKTSQNDMSTNIFVPIAPGLVLNPTMDYKFQQEYDFKRLEFNISPEIFRYGKLTGSLAGYLSYNRFASDTELSTSLPQISASRDVRGNFKDHAFGVGVGASLEHQILQNMSLMFAARYDWCRFEGDTKVKDKEKSAYGEVARSYKESTEVDLTGPAIGIFVRLNF